MRGLVLIAALALRAVNAPSPTDVPQVTDAESYRVYAAALALTARDQPWRLSVVREETTTYDDCMSSGERIPREWKTVWADYVEKNKKTWRVLAGMELGAPYKVLSTNAIRQQTDARGGELWLNGRSHTYVEVSAVGFDADRMRAMVYASYHCGGLCAGGRHWLLERHGNHWVSVTPNECFWVSD